MSTTGNLFLCEREIRETMKESRTSARVGSRTVEDSGRTAIGVVRTKLVREMELTVWAMVSV